MNCARCGAELRPNNHQLATNVGDRGPVRFRCLNERACDWRIRTRNAERRSRGGT